MQDLLDLTDALGVQALFSLHGTKMHERITEKLLLLRRHQPSIQGLGIPPPRLIIFVQSRNDTRRYLFSINQTPKTLYPTEAACPCSRLVALALDERNHVLKL